MPFEVGLAVATAYWRPTHQWFVFEAKKFRIQQTLSDLGGTDAYVHGDRPRGLLIALGDALIRATKQPTFNQLERTHSFLQERAERLRPLCGWLCGARDVRDLVVAATDLVARVAAGRYSGRT